MPTWVIIVLVIAAAYLIGGLLVGRSTRNGRRKMAAALESRGLKKLSNVHFHGVVDDLPVEYVRVATGGGENLSSWMEMRVTTQPGLPAVVIVEPGVNDGITRPTTVGLNRLSFGDNAFDERYELWSSSDQILPHWPDLFRLLLDVGNKQGYGGIGQLTVGGNQVTAYQGNIEPPAEDALGTLNTALAIANGI